MTKTGVTIRRTHRERAPTFERIRRGPKGKNRGYRDTCWSFVREFADLFYPYHFSSAYCPYRLPDIILYSLGPSRLDTSRFTNSHNCRFIFATSRDTQQQTNNHLREKLPRLFLDLSNLFICNPRLVLDLQKTEFISRPTFAPIDSLTLSQSGPSKVRFIIFVNWTAIYFRVNHVARIVNLAQFQSATNQKRSFLPHRGTRPEPTNPWNKLP